MKDGPASGSATTGARSRSATTRSSSTPRRRRSADLLKPGLQGQGGPERQPATSGSAVAGVFAAALANGGSLSNVSPGIDFFAKLKTVGQLHPGAVDAADGRLGPDADLDRLGLPEPRLRPRSSRPRSWKMIDPVRRRLRRLLLPGDQRDGSAPVGGPALGGVPLLRPGPAALAQGLLAPGPVPGPGQAEGDPGVAARRRCPGRASTRR